MSQNEIAVSREGEPAAAAPIAASADSRIGSLDFIRGIAVMGILLANIISFGQPATAYLYPAAFTVPHSRAEDWMWVAQFVLIDGKMRGLFTLLFGAGMVLFLERAAARGQGVWLQVRRLFWLGLFGIVHFLFIWRGDILFLYACAGLAALLFLGLSRRNMLILGLLSYVGGAFLYTGVVGFLPLVADGELGGRAAFAELADELEAGKQDELADGRLETRLISAGDYSGWVLHNLTEHASELPTWLLLFWFETLPLILVGMAAYRYGLFDGGLDSGRQRSWGWGLLLFGTVLTVPIALWAKDGGLTYYGTLAAMMGWSMVPRLFAILGLAALLSLWGQGVRGALAERVSAAGRAAFTNYLGTSILMMLVFHGWAGGLFGKLGRTELYGVAFATCGVMLFWSRPWLERFRFGPLEWLWRCLTYWRLFPLRR
ncbi:DUF418 domain-containing protein [Qipengyuania sp. 6B39]|uniref:DUF418 domain-containing protein n=1 Tax=Qipengyuania proteolytica TaxID=2867239 RepID=UPI001C8AC2B0|nr:DUF418 domain-containing protein [Qipengyuania proteolytica]MBX7496831.1 DUF418 domain-containing protein [Qipengyuania proteolytica]